MMEHWNIGMMEFKPPMDADNRRGRKGRREAKRLAQEDGSRDGIRSMSKGVIPIPPGSRNVATNTVLPRFFAQKVATKVATFLGWGRYILLYPRI